MGAYEGRRREIAEHQDYAVRVALYTFSAVTVVVGFVALREKGIAAAVARETACDVLDSETETQLAHRAAVARWRRQTGPTDRRAEAAVVRHLQGRGFDTGLAVRTTRATRPQDRDADEEMT